jgi:hypothetical protein
MSIPLQLEDQSIQTLLPTAQTKLFSFSTGYDTTSFFSQGHGYFVKLPEAVTKDISGQSYSDHKIALTGQWNMIGVFEDSIPVAKIKTNPTDIIKSFFFGYDEGYYIADTLKTGQAYWVLSGKAGIIDSSRTLAKKSWFAKELNVDEAIEGKIEVQDSKGRKKILLVTKKAEIIEQSIVPPVPPIGIFDVRWGSGRFAEDVSTTGKEIIFSSDAYPIMIKVEDVDLKFQDKISGQIVNQLVHKGESITIANPTIERLEVSNIIPTKYELFQNYPNPFNPTTKIKFGLPQQSMTRLTIFNMLGERVEELINKELEPGFYEVEWNASKCATGVYLMQVTAGKFNAVKKLLLLK